MTGEPTPRRRFATTHWSVVHAAGGTPSEGSARALATLCAEYWYPLYAYVRRRGHDADDARDLTQSFFAKLLEGRGLAAADPARGRFRTFLLSSMKNFLAGEWRRETALKRGGGAETLSIDIDGAEERYGVEATHQLSPDAIYERRWALGLLDRAVTDLRLHYVDAGKADLFDALQGYVGGGDDALPYTELAERLGQSPGALRTAVSRLRRRWRDRLRELIAETVEDPADIDDELRSLLETLARTSSPSV